MNWADIHYFSSFALSTFAGVFGIRFEENPVCQVLLRDRNFEIRRYRERTAAAVDLEGDEGRAFRRLAGYILGANVSAKKIAMTAPVEVSQAGRIERTSPFEVSGGAKPEMVFGMPVRYSLEDLPRPSDPGIRLVKIPERVVASIRFRGVAGAADRRRAEILLREWIGGLGHWRLASDSRFAGYDSPFAIPFLRRNEVHVDLSPVS